MECSNPARRNWFWCDTPQRTRADGGAIPGAIARLGPHIGKLDKGLDEAAAKGWTVVDMKTDWNKVFAFEK